MQSWLNALLLRMDGDTAGDNKPSGVQVAVVYTAATLLVSKLLS